MKTAEFDFELPEERIALEPARPRDSARLLHVGEALTDRSVHHLPDVLRAGDVLVLNDTRVLPAQLHGTRGARAAGGGDERVPIDVTLHKRSAPDHAEQTVWRAFVRPAKRVREGDLVEFGRGLSAQVIQRSGAEALLRFDVGGAAFDAALQQAGRPPLPPYIARKRALQTQDAEDYQTVYAAEPGSVAAPTAGLHFTDELFSRLDAQGVLRETITLHVGAGTFLPVTADDTADHVMHAEWGEITAAQANAINEARRQGGRVVAVGTTALRLLESAAAEDGTILPFCGDTSIFITPGYRFRATDMLLTNFHLPCSTLFMLVCAFSGMERMKRAYAHAVETGYRFYSYGDACLLEPS